MGHNQRNANRAAGIAKNTERYKELGKKVRNLELEAKGIRRAMEREQDRRRRHETALLDRLELLERPLWRKAADWMSSSYRRYFPLPPTDFEIVEAEPLPEELEAAPIEAIPLEEVGAAINEAAGLDKEPPVELEIVNPPAEAVALAKSADAAIKRHAEELTDGPPDG